MSKAVIAACFIGALLAIAAGAQAKEVRAAMKIEINGHGFLAALESNATAEAFRSLLPLTLDMSELNGNEKYHYLTRSLPSAPESVKNIRTGDIMLYGDNCLVVFYKSFPTSYSYTRIGRIEDADALESAVGKGSVTVTFEKK